MQQIHAEGFLLGKADRKKREGGRSASVDRSSRRKERGRKREKGTDRQTKAERDGRWSRPF